MESSVTEKQRAGHPQNSRDESDAGQPNPKQKQRQKQKSISEARRLQNRISSKKYREKRKQKLQTLNTLEQLLDETENISSEKSIEPTSVVGSDRGGSIGTYTITNVPAFVENPPIYQQEFPVQSLNTTQSFDADLYNNSWTQAFHDSTSTPKTFDAEILQQPESEPRWGRGLGTPTDTGAQGQCATVDEPYDDVLDISDRKETIAPISATKFASFMKMLTRAQRHELYNTSVESGMRFLDLFCGGIEAAFGKLALRKEDQSGICEYIKPNFTRIVAQGIPMFLASMPTKRYGFIYRPTYGADIRMNNIRVDMVYFLAASYTNCRVLGYDFNDFIEDDAVSPICSDEEGSGQPQAISKRFSTVPKDLRPTPMQIKTPHHLYVDLFPFPAFRERIITAAYADPPILDEGQFCIDLLGDGMICYGSANGGIGTPWDKRNWEPQTWFLEKYWFLVGDKDDEMWSAAKWWQSMRGED